MSVDNFLLSASATDLNYPEIRPSLDLNFARTKTLDPRITFTRSSGGSYVGADGLIKYAGVNEARFDHNPVTGESLGLLIEESRQNLSTNSIFLSNMTEKNNVTVTDNSIISPDGTQNASKIIETLTVETHNLSQLNVSTTQNTTYTISGYFKKAERKIVGISFRNVTFWGGVTGPQAIFNLDTGTLVTTTGVIVSTTITPVGNGWYRCSATATRDGNGTVTSAIAVAIYNDSAQSIFLGLGYGIYAWGLQFEQGAFPTSYIPTQASTRTRQPDVARITGTNFSSWYRQDEGTVFGDYVGVNNVSGGTRRLVEIGVVGSANDRMILGYGSVTFSRFLVVAAGASQADINPSATQGARIKAAACFAVNNFQQGVNGNLGTADTSGNVPTVSAIAIGNDFTSSAASSLNGTISRLTYYPKALPNSQLRALTR